MIIIAGCLIEKDNSNILLIKGAPELLLERCAYIQKGKEIKLMNEPVKKEILCEIEKYIENNKIESYHKFEEVNQEFEQIELEVNKYGCKKYI